MSRQDFLYGVGCAGAAALGGCIWLGCRKDKGDGMSPDRPTTRPHELAYCGIDCTGCDVFKATVHGDGQARRRAVEVWTKTAQQHWGMQTLDPAVLNCRRCRTEGEKLFRGCRDCPIRRCARQRDLSSCGLCPEWRQCPRLASLLADSPEARRNLERISEGPAKSTND